MPNGRWWKMVPPAKHGGRRREVNVREVVNGVSYLLATG
jgi:hypothetical protein